MDVKIRFLSVEAMPCVILDLVVVVTAGCAKMSWGNALEAINATYLASRSS